MPSTNGIMGVVDPRGDDVIRAPAQAPAFVTAQIQLGSGVTTGVRLGDRAQIPIAAIAISALVVATIRRRRAA